MKVAFRSSFIRDLKKIKDRSILEQVKQAIEDIECAQDLRTVSNIKKLGGGRKFYRIRIGNYRVGLVVQGGEVEFVRCLHRRDIYRFFP